MASTSDQATAPDVPESSTKAKLTDRVVLNPADCNIDFDVEGNGLLGSALHEQGFAYCWSGARANVGITRGRYCFGCKVISYQQVEMEDTPVDQQNVCRLGISRGDDNVGNLGESDYSFGFGGTGKFSHAGKFFDFGERFGIGDTIVCAVDLEKKPMASIGFSKNGRWLGEKPFSAGPHGFGVLDSPVGKLEWESAVFPHILLKNVVVQMQFSVDDGIVPVQGYKPWASALEEGTAILGPSFSKPEDCHVLMMIGLPASGKSTWAEKWVKQYPDKRYVVLGTNLALDQMKVPGLLRNQNYGERFDCLMDRATGIFNTLLARASKIPRNYILDQTNVYKSARKRKLAPFANFQKMAIVVFPTPHELRLRSEKRFREMGKEVPAEAVNEMLANYLIPMDKGMWGADESFDSILFTELDRSEALRALHQMKTNLKSNQSSQNKLTPYSGEICNSTVQNHREHPALSYSSYLQNYQARPAQSQYLGSVPAASGNWQSSYPLQPVAPPPPTQLIPASPYSTPGYSTPSYSTPGYSTPGAPQSLPSDPYGNYLYPGGYGYAHDYSKSGIVNNMPAPGYVADSYGAHSGNSNVYTSSNTGNSNMPAPNPSYATNSYPSGTVEPYGSTSSAPYNPNGGYGVQGQPTYQAGTPTSYGPPYGNPMPRLSYGNYPTHQTQHNPGGYVLTRPRYY